MQRADMIINTYVDGWVNWLLPAKVSFSAMPNPLQDITDIDPTNEQIERYTKGSFLPYFGTMRYIEKTV